MEEKEPISGDTVTSRPFNLFQNLPEEIRFIITSNLSVKDVLSSRLVCRNWRDDPATTFKLRNFHPPINFQTDIELKYFTWLMKTTPGTSSPFSKFKFHFKTKFKQATIKEFVENYGSQITEIIFHAKIYGHYKDRTISAYEIQRKEAGLVEYGQVLSSLVLNIPTITSLSLSLLHNFKFPAISADTYFNSFQNLKQFKVKFRLGYPYEYDETSLVENILKNCCSLQTLSLFYDTACSAFGGVSGRHKLVMKSAVLQSLPNYLNLLSSTETKVELKLGIITDDFQNVIDELLYMPPRVVTLSFGLEGSLHPRLKVLIWKWIQNQPIEKFKFWSSNDSIAIQPFHAVKQLLMYIETPLSRNLQAIFPNVQKLSIDFRNPRYSHNDFLEFASSLPYLEHLEVEDYLWPILTGHEDNRMREEDILNMSVDSNRETVCRSPLLKLNALRFFEIGIENWHDSRDFLAVFWASTQCKLQRMKRITFKIFDITKSKYEGSRAIEILASYHDSVEFRQKDAFYEQEPILF